MIPAMIEAHLREHYRTFEVRTHEPAATAQELAAREHVSGYRVAKTVVLKLNGALALAVVPATHRVDIDALAAATAAYAEFVTEPEFAKAFEPCEPGAEPPFAIFGARIFADEWLLREDRLLMPAGTHADAVLLDTQEWAALEGVESVPYLAHHDRVAA